VSKIFFALWDFPAKLLWDKDLKKENAYIGISDMFSFMGNDQ